MLAVSSSVISSNVVTNALLGWLRDFKAEIEPQYSVPSLVQVDVKSHYADTTL